jgi:hypothetical protein
MRRIEDDYPFWEGYWRSTADEVRDLPWPVADTAWPGRVTFLAALDKVEPFAARVQYRGLSPCRICACDNGHETLLLDDWHWPAGYRHYIADHGVRPTAAFEAFVRMRDVSGLPPVPPRRIY